MKKILCLCTVVCFLSISYLQANGGQLELKSDISVGEEFTDNHFLSKDNQKSEIITTISPELSGKATAKLHGIEASYKPSYAAYNNYDENNTLRHNASVKGWLDTGKNTRIEFGNIYSLTEDPLSETDVVSAREERPDLLIDDTLRRSRQSYYTNFANASLSHQFGEDDTITIRYIEYILENDDPILEDSAKHNPSVELTFWPISKRFGIEANVFYTKGEFSDNTEDFSQWNPTIRLIYRWSPHFDIFMSYSHTVMDYSATSPDYQIFNPSAGLTWTISEKTKFSADVGFFENDDPNQKNDSGGTANAKITSVFKRGSLNLSGSGGYEETYFGAENLGFSKYYEVGISSVYKLSHRLNCNVFCSFKNNRYEEKIIDREDKTNRVGGGMNFQPFAWLSLMLKYIYRSVESSTPIDEYSENRIQFEFSIATKNALRMTF